MCASTHDMSSPHGNDQRSVTIQENRIKSIDLLDAQGQLIIEHRGRRYQLRETRNGNLILTS